GFFKHKWHPPSWSYVEPLKDASADLLRMRNGLCAPSDLFAERGKDWDQHIEQTIADNMLAIRAAKKAALEINNDPELRDGAPVHWRECLSLPTPDGVQVTAGAPPKAAPASSNPRREADE